MNRVNLELEQRVAEQEALLQNTQVGIVMVRHRESITCNRRRLHCVRDTDTVSRQGGDEFIIVLSNIAEPDDGPDFDTLLKKADMAMYRAKDAGRNTYRFFDPQMNVAAVEQLRMRNGRRRTLERHEFVLHYQPQISLASNAEDAVALARLRVFGCDLAQGYFFARPMPAEQFVSYLDKAALALP